VVTFTQDNVVGVLAVHVR